MLSVIEDLVKENNLTVDPRSKVTPADLNNIERYTGIKLTCKMRQLLMDLGKLEYYNEKADDKILVIHGSVKPADYTFFGRGTNIGRTGACVGYPVKEISNIREYKDYWKGLLGEEYTHEGKTGSVNELYPMPLFDSYGDSHIIICIDWKGNVVEFCYELDNDGANVLTNSQDDFVNKIHIGY